MSDKPDVSADDLRSIALLRGFTDEQLSTILALAEPVQVDGTPLFEMGDLADAFYLLTKGQVELSAAGDETYKLSPLVVIGELGALTARNRNSTATVTDDAELWRVGINPLVELFESDRDIGLGFQQNLIQIVAEKIERDQRRLQDMRANIVRTQKAMKQMRDLLLESTDTEVSEPLHDTIDAIIKRNRRVNYRVEPPQAMAASVRFDSGDTTAVEQISRTHVSYRHAGGDEPAAGDRLSAVLTLSGPEIPMSGVVLRVWNGRVDIELDALIPEYETTLEGYLTRVQMLDFLV